MVHSSPVHHEAQTPEVVSKAGDKGIAQLQDAVHAFGNAQSPLLYLMQQVAASNVNLHGSFATGRLPFTGPSETGFTDDSARSDAESEDLALRARASEMRVAMAAIAKEQAGGGAADKASIAKGVESVKAFSDELAKASRLVGKWQEWQGEIGEDKTYSSLGDALAKYRDAVGPANSAIQGIIAGSQASGLPVTANANAGAAPGATNSFASVPSGSGASGFTNTLIPATAVLSTFSDQTQTLTGQFQSLVSYSTQMNAAFATLLQQINTPVAGSSTSQSSSGVGRVAGSVTINSVNLPPLDAHATSQVIVAKLVPIIKSAVDQQKRQAEATANAVRTQGGL